MTVYLTQIKSLMMTAVLSVLLLPFSLFTNPETTVAGSTEDIEEGEGRILVFSKTTGWRHESIEPGKEALRKMANENGFDITVTEDASYFTEDNLQQYDAVVFLNTTETIFNDKQRRAFESYIQSGGGFAGIHSAADTEYNWPWYNRLVGAYFLNHPNNPNVREAVIDVQVRDHISTEMLPDRWERADEWYNFKSRNESVHVLMWLDTDSYEGSEHPGSHPIAWYHEYDGGRAFYTGLGHTSESFTEDELFLKHLWGGIRYAMGED